MCGITGYIKGHQNQYDDSTIIRQMTDLIRHRGPDSEGFYTDDHITMGFRRLKIIDLTPEGDQPFYSDNQNLVLTFNGEIYNFQALRKELESLGYTFVSHTDSEVIVHGYDAWGKDVLNKLRGMFAFAIWNKKEESLFLARDFFGIKPLYYGQASKDGTFFYTSEIKSLLAHPSFHKEMNEKALRPYLSFQYSVTEETFFKGIYKLEPGCWLEIKNGALKKGRYWYPSFNAQSERSLASIVGEIDTIMRESVRVHQISDVKVGAFLSGGIDSSFVTSLFVPEDTFSVGFETEDHQFDETELGKRLSEIKGFTHHRKMISPDEFFEALPVIQYHMDEPQSNLSSVPLYFLAKLASEHVTVVLSGEGADELFGGYDAYVDTPHLSLYKKLPHPLRRGFYHLATKLPDNRLTDLMKRGGRKPEEYFLGEAEIFPAEEAEAILQPSYQGGPAPLDVTKPVYQRHATDDDLTKQQMIDILLWMPGDILLKADKMSSAHSLELRVPFLDKRVMEVASQIPSHYRVHHGVSKYALREAALKELPEEWAQRPKKGFPVPIKYWLREEKYAQPIREAFASEAAAKFFRVASLQKLLDDHINGVADNQRKIYTVYTFLLWYREFFEKRS